MTGAGWCWLTLEGKIGVQREGWLYLRPFLPSKDMQTFATQVSEYTKSRFNISSSPDSVDLTFSVALHEAVMLYAHAATKVLAEGGDLRDGRAVTAALRNTVFEGVGGTEVVLDSNGDRIESYEVMNYVVGADGVMSSVPVGVYNHTLQQYMAYERVVVFPGGTTDVPPDTSQGCFHCSLCPLFFIYLFYYR